MCAVSIALAALSKKLLEDPIRFRADWVRGRAGMLTLGVTMAALATLWVVLPNPPALHVDITNLGLAP